jgi:uncharacterized protein involved in response to NO
MTTEKDRNMPKLCRSLFHSPFWGRGFRPFFFFGALFAVLVITIWGGFYAGWGATPPIFMMNPISWHAHEMIYGFSMAIVAGFLLTAVANWTGGAPARQIHLAGLCFLWILGRIAMGINMGLPEWALIALTTMFVPALAISLAIPLLRSWNKRNFIFLTLLTLLFVCDVWFMVAGSMVALHVALMVILMMVSLIGGRIIPAFTVAALRRRGMAAFQTDQFKTDMAALFSLIAVTICLVYKETAVLGVVAGISCIIHGWRMRHYHVMRALADPMIWILHAGYAWLVVGLGLLSLSGFGVFEIKAVIHALTAGCIGSMVLGMMCRVTLGHTGRELMAGSMTTLSFYGIQIAAVMRVFGPMLAPDNTTNWIVYSALLWGLCFAAYLITYSGMLFTARPDGREA